MPLTLNPTEVQCALEEYKALRAESVHYVRERREVLTLCSVICGALFVYGFTQKNGYVLSMPLYIVIGCMFLSMASFNATQRIGAYLNVFTENRLPGMYWERALHEVYSLQGRRPGKWAVRGNRFYFICGYTFFYTSIAVASAAGTRSLTEPGYSAPVCIAGLLLVFLGDVLAFLMATGTIHSAWHNSFAVAFETIFGYKWERRPRLTPPSTEDPEAPEAPGKPRD
jgi:hypothetical protein